MQENKEQITYVRVEGMFCVHCEETVILALKALPGVLSVSVSFYRRMQMLFRSTNMIIS